ncbi:MAG: oxidoreductase [Lentisphaerae bacterium GWF2_52_8]|nr:MAG: oxidoreductase [Lentisphaerae bacterium GWF2_52_8]
MKKENKIKALLVGCGGISKAWLDSLARFDDVSIVGLFDLKKDNAIQRKKEYALANAAICESLDEALETLNPDIVFDCSIPAAHAEISIKALAHGCHVLGEKPMAENMKDARRMLQAARKSGRTYAVIQNRRYMDGIVRFRDFLRNGSIGELTTLNCDFYIGAHFGGFRDEMEHVLILDMAIHSFDQARFISGADPMSAYCHEWNPKGSWYRHGASAIVIFEMSNGIVLNYRGSWCAEGLNTTWEADWRAICSTGSATWDGGDKFKAQSVGGPPEFMSPLKDIEVPPLSTALAHTGHSGVIREFLDCVKSGKVPQTICEDNIKSIAMVHAAIKSAETGKKVPVKY